MNLRKYRRVTIFVLLLIILSGGVLGARILLDFEKNEPTFLDLDPIYEATMKRDLLCIMLAYPEYIVGVERSPEGKVYAVMKSGKKLLYDDKKEKNRWQLSGNPDLQDMLEEIYPLYEIKELMPVNYNPGVIRVYPILKEVYGSSKSQILSSLQKVSIGYKYVEFNHHNQAANALKSVMKELLPLARKSNKVYSVSFPASGTFNYRLIDGTNRLSAHAFGIAIDLANHEYDYWRWATREQGQKRLNKYAMEVPQIFEKYGFIWGGKWGNFDIMHYEYRPEIILKARYFSEKPVPGIPWYEGLQNNQEAWKFIWLIEQNLG